MSHSRREHLLDLLASEATEGLDVVHAEELERLVAEFPDVERDGMALAAAALDRALAPADRAMPAALAARILAQSSDYLPARAVKAPQLLPRTDSTRYQHRVLSAPPRLGGLRLAWTLAAAAALLAAIGWWPRLASWPGQPTPETAERPETPAEPTAAEARAALLAEAADLVERSWTATEDPAATGAAGDVVWSDARDEGYMRFVGLQANDPTVSQYQLWIFDRNRDERYPIDGGVFDVPGDGEIIVPIRAKLAVDEAVLFAVTVERPGGVVVSSRERIVLVAPKA